MLAGIGVIPAWIACIVIVRDLFVNALRMFGNDNGSDVAASLSGKLKTVFQLSTVVLALLGIAYGGISTYPLTKFGEFISSMNADMITTLINVFMSVAVVGTVTTTLWSLIDYIFRFKKDIDVEK